MRDVKEHLKELDGLASPELWDDITKRTPRDAMAEERSSHQRTWVVAFALILTVVSLAFLVRAFRAGERSIGGETSVPTGSIVFSTQRADDMTPVVALMSVDGSGFRRLTPGDQPAVSPDGTMIAFTRTTAKGTGIFVMDIDGGAVGRLTFNRGGIDDSPSWSPDARIAFTRSGPSVVGRDIWIVDLQGRTQKLTGAPSDDYSPDWSPDGLTIAFVRNLGGPIDVVDTAPQLWLTDADGSHPRRLTTGHRFADAPAWSPDGALIAFHADGTIFTIAAAGGPIARVPTGRAVGAAFPTWSPDGRWLAFGAGGDDERDIFLCRLDGSGLRRISLSGGHDEVPTWIDADVAG
jgi:TolB protein